MNVQFFHTFSGSVRTVITTVSSSCGDVKFDFQSRMFGFCFDDDDEAASFHTMVTDRIACPKCSYYVRPLLSVINIRSQPVQKVGTSVRGEIKHFRLVHVVLTHRPSLPQHQPLLFT